MKKFLTPLFIASLILPATSSFAAQVLCVNNTTKALTVETACPSGTTRVSGSNFGTTVGTKGVNYAKCYTQSGSSAGSTSDGRVSVALACKSTSDVVVNDTFETDNSLRAQPALGSKTVLFSKGTKQPNGVQFEAQGNPNVYYTVNASIVCCPQS